MVRSTKSLTILSSSSFEIRLPVYIEEGSSMRNGAIRFHLGMLVSMGRRRWMGRLLMPERGGLNRVLEDRISCWSSEDL